MAASQKSAFIARVVQVASGAQAEGLGRWDAALEVLSEFVQCFNDCNFAFVCAVDDGFQSPEWQARRAV